MPATIDIEALGLDGGAHLLIKRGLAALPVGEEIAVTGSARGLAAQVAAWCRQQGHGFSVAQENGSQIIHVTRGSADFGRWSGATLTGLLDPKEAGAVLDQAEANWGLAARGATVEAGSPAFAFRLNQKSEVWAEDPAQMYAQAVAAQWKADEAIDWKASFELPDFLEDAVVQIFTYMIENENAALVIPAKFLAEMHPHFREVQAVLAMQVADEARHIDVFTRRIGLKGRVPALSTTGGQESLKTLVNEPDFSVAEFLLSVLGEGTFVTLLTFLSTYAPDPVTRQMTKLAARDEARHVAFGMAHQDFRLKQEPELRSRLARAVEARYEALAETSGLNEEVFDSLIVYAAGSIDPPAIARGFQRVQQLLTDMALGRRARLVNLGFDPAMAHRLSTMHTRNFM